MLKGQPVVHVFVIIFIMSHLTQRTSSGSQVRNVNKRFVYILNSEICKI